MSDRSIGRKVRILQHFHEIVDDFGDITVVYATKDSIGVLLSYDLYATYMSARIAPEPENRRSRDATLRHLAWVKSAMQANTHYPVRFEQCEPLPEADFARLKHEYTVVEIVCQTGAVTVLPASSFVLI